MVMPRSRSISIESRICSFISRSVTLPHSWISRSDKVDLPWSMWAMIEKLRMREVSVMGRWIAPFAAPTKGGKGRCVRSRTPRRAGSSPLPPWPARPHARRRGTPARVSARAGRRDPTHPPARQSAQPSLVRRASRLAASSGRRIVEAYTPPHPGLQFGLVRPQLGSAARAARSVRSASRITHRTSFRCCNPICRCQLSLTRSNCRFSVARPCSTEH